MAEATLRGHVEIDGQSAKALSKAGWPVEVRYFIPKVGTKAAKGETNGKTRAARTSSINTRNNFVGVGTGDSDPLYGDRKRVAIAAVEAINKEPHKMARRLKLRNFLMAKLKLNRQQASSQLTHVIRLGVLKDLGQFPPEWNKGKQS